MENNKFDVVAFVNLATKYLDRVELKGVNEAQEFNQLLHVFVLLQNGSLKVEQNSEGNIRPINGLGEVNPPNMSKGEN